jgi:acyl-CoA synthetase (AMP-forming)/AMP-acid ligase II
MEVPCILALLSRFNGRGGMRAILYPDKVEGVPWVGDLKAVTPAAIEDEEVSELVLQTSGTTGSPKTVVRRDFRSYFAGKKGAGAPDDIWLLTYNPFRWAGISLLCHVLKHSCAVAVPRSFDLQDIVECGAEATHVSLTPSLFRRMLIQFPETDLRSLAFRQITFGGETASQTVLDQARQCFPRARISHTYASSEFGDICSTSDGCAGFDEKKFEKFSFSEEGELLIGGVATGDLWRRDEGRYYFVGRVQDEVSVGGNRVSLHAVEEAALGVDGVQQAIARAVTSPLVGQLVVLDFVGDCAPHDLMQALRQALPRHACPARLQRVDHLELTDAGKAKR